MQLGIDAKLTLLVFAPDENFCIFQHSLRFRLDIPTFHLLGLLTHVAMMAVVVVGGHWVCRNCGIRPVLFVAALSWMRHPKHLVAVELLLSWALVVHAWSALELKARMGDAVQV